MFPKINKDFEIDFKIEELKRFAIKIADDYLKANKKKEEKMCEAKNLRTRILSEISKIVSSGVSRGRIKLLIENEAANSLERKILSSPETARQAFDGTVEERLNLLKKTFNCEVVEIVAAETLENRKFKVVTVPIVTDVSAE